VTQRRFVVLDRDGTVISERHYLSAPEDVELIPEAGSALRRLRDEGLGLVLVTNQSAIGRAFFDHSRLEAIHQQLRHLLRREGVELDGIYVCPHLPEDNCSCRKPKTGLLDLASRELSFDVRSSFVVGDKPCDIELGQQVGATTFLVLTGYGARVFCEKTAAADYTVGDLAEAVRIILYLLALSQGIAT
jgi:D-glycero-D-manno-heptose 1,7-bisphosphate phosphatase